MAQDLPKEFIDRLKAVTAKRARTVIEHILKHGHITTEELKNLYGYDHPPRAARDVREWGIPLETFRVPDSRGKKIAAYRLADPTQVRRGTLSGRKVFSKQLKQTLLSHTDSKCSICQTEYESRYLQVDHRAPYQVAGESTGETECDRYMLICGSCNRAKSWSCEHCTNSTQAKQPEVCCSCYWASPDSYKHIALREIRRLDLSWTGGETVQYDRLANGAKGANAPLPEFVKAILRIHLKESHR